jgi:hypothetical protein
MTARRSVQLDTHDIGGGGAHETFGQINARALRTHRQQQQEWAFPRQRGQVLRKEHGGGVAPVQILEHEGDRCLGCKATNQSAYPGEDAPHGSLGAGLSDLGQMARDHVFELPERCAGFFGERSPTCSDRDPDPLGLYVEGKSQPAEQHVPKWQVGDGVGVGQAGCFQPCACTVQPMVIVQSPDQSALAQTGFSAEHNDSAAARAELIESLS